MKCGPREVWKDLLFAILLTTIFGPAATNAQSTSVEKLEQEIQKRDSLINDLIRRIEALEQKLGEKPKPPDEVATAPVENSKKPQGAIDIGEEESTRALERTLVRERATVLPLWSIEIEPGYTYTYRGQEGVRLATADGQQLLVLRDIKRDTSVNTFAARLGLPFNSQLDFTIPYLFVQQESATGGSSKQRRSGWGDTQLALTKELLRERNWIPDLLTSVTWKSDSGKSGIGSGFDAIQAELTAVKRRDPLAFFGSIAHTWNLSEKVNGNEIDLSNVLTTRLGAILATSPDTSFRFALEVGKTGRDQINGMKISGSNRTAALFEFGVATIVLPRTLLDVRAGVGLTSDSPDFRFGISLPIRLY